MIIKKWTGSAWQAQSAKTNAADLVVDVTAATPTALFDIAGSNIKLKPAYLPDSVFDGLTFVGTTSGNVGTAITRGVLASVLISAYHTYLNDGGMKGKYYVINTAGTITGLTGIQETLLGSEDPGDGEYATLQFRPQDGGSNSSPNTSSGALEAGDWFVIESVTGGDGSSSANARIFTAAVINNVYEVMGGASAGAAGTPGLVPSSSAGDQLKFLRADATWVVPANDNTTYSISTVNGGDAYSEKIRLTDSGAGTDDVTIAVGAVGSTYGLTIEQASDVITIKHADTSTQASVNNSGRTYIQDITLDEYGHITGIQSATETVTDTTYSAGNGISLAGTEFSVAAGVGLTQEASGLKMTQPFISSASTPGASYQVANNIWFDIA